MASLEKIKICGIRSFGPNEEDVQTIKFQKPLTLILGENGCGKSTVIECLRYLTAQKEPAGKGTFVHDPSLTGRTSVKAFVKLQIKDAKGNRIDLCRQVQSTRTKKTLTTKSLDNVITRSMKGSKEKQSISNRCADFTYEISRIFGVSKAILENVIFCTQEDSHWPLETDQKLKEKFDQIFDSDRYNKCVSKVREKVKKIRECIKIADVEIKYLEGNKKVAGEKRREIENTKRQIKNCESEIAELTSSLRPIDERLKEINEKEMEMSKNLSLKETKKMELKQTEEYITELKGRIGSGYEGSDQELKDAVINFSKELAVKQKEISKLEEKVMEWDRKEAKLSRELMSEQGKLGQLQKEEEINIERLTERNQKLNTLAIQLDIESDEMSQNSEDSVQYLISKVEIEIRSKAENIKVLRQNYAKQELDLQSDIDELRRKSLIVHNDVSNKESSIKANKEEMAQIKRELNEIEMSASKLSRIETQLSEVSVTIEQLQQKVDTERLRNEIQTTSSERNSVEDRLVEVEESIKVLQQNSSVSAELEIQKELLSGKESVVRRLLNKHRDTLRSLLGEEPSSGFKVVVQSQIDKLKRSVKELMSKLTRKERELTEMDMKRKHQKEQLRQKEEKLRSIEEEIYEECGSDDFDDVVTSLRNQIDELQDLKGILTSSEYMYQKYIKSLQKSQPCCPLCHRDFPRQSEAQDLVEELTSKLEEVPSKLTENKDLLEEKQTKYNKLLTLRSKYDQIVTLKNETIPDMRKEQEVIELSIKKIRKEIDEINIQILPCQTDEAICLSMQGDMVLLDQLQLERKKIAYEIEKLESKLGSRSEGNLEAMFLEQETFRKRLKTLRATLEDLQGKLNSHNEELQIQQAKKNALMEEKNKIQGGELSRKQLKSRYAELQGMEVTHSEELNALKEKLRDVTSSLNDMTSKKNIEKEKNMDELDKLNQTFNGFQKQLQEIQTLNNKIDGYQCKGIGYKLEVVQTTIKNLENDLRAGKTMRERTAKTIGEIQLSLLDQEKRERELQDNVKYRERIKHRDILHNEVLELERKYGNINLTSMVNEKRKLKDQEDAIGRKKALIRGRMGELDLKIEALQKELAGKMLKNVEADYKKELVKLVTFKSCAKDLERYAATMDYAMMKYHKQKMMRVNSFIREYWMKIYEGNDIDFIEIQTDTVASTDKRRSYNYKLIQSKEGVALDMRNRCSAGQKMLASLIIRMALAETFSCNCGILTLDEPTTNLDRKNIRNLARTLGEVINAKQSHENGNFQLIVITHDEDFLRELMDIEAVSHYVRVQRNTMGKTRVTNEVFDGTIPRFGTAHSSHDDLNVITYD